MFNQESTTTRGVSANEGNRKWMVYRENLIKIDDLGVPPILGTPKWRCDINIWDLGLRTVLVKVASVAQALLTHVFCSEWADILQEMETPCHPTAPNTF